MRNLGCVRLRKCKRRGTWPPLNLQTVIFLIVWTFAAELAVSALSPAEEKQLLLDFKYDGRSYRADGDVSTWSSNTYMCSRWSGVECTTGGNVEQLSLAFESLTGTLPPQWSAMTSVTHMYLYSNQLTGTLPPQWSAMTSVTTMSLFSNQLTGTLPPQWSAMTSVTEMYLYSNQLTGTLPPQWSTMTSVTHMYLYSNQLTGTLPPQWSAMGGISTGWPSPPPSPPPPPPLLPPLPWWLEWYFATGISFAAGIVGASLLLVGSETNLSFQNFVLSVLSCADIFSDILSAIEMFWNRQDDLFWSASALLLASSLLFFIIFNILGTFGRVFDDNKMHQLFAHGLGSLIKFPWFIPRAIKKSTDTDGASFVWVAFFMPVLLFCTPVAACISASVLLLGALMVVSVWGTMVLLESEIIIRLYGSNEGIGKFLVFVRILEDIGETAIQVIYGFRVGFTGATIASLIFACWQIMGVGMAYFYIVFCLKKRIHPNDSDSDASSQSHDSRASFVEFFNAGAGAFINAAASAWSP